MDPVSAIIGIASGAAGLIALTGQVVTCLTALHDSIQNTELTILDLVSTCQAYRTAWTHIELWASQYTEHRQQRQQESTSIISELDTFLQIGEIVMRLIQTDLVRILPKRSSWRISSKRRFKGTLGLLLHEKAIAEHATRLHRQNTSLNLLISILTLPSIPLQEAAIDVLRPKFRKDEETAWTIVNTYPSSNSRWRKQTLASSRDSIRSSKIFGPSFEYGSTGKTFSFEDDLFSGPVYKRLLIAKLCEQPLIGPTIIRTQTTSSNIGQSSQRMTRAVTAPAKFLQDCQRDQNFRITRRAATVVPAVVTTPYSGIHEEEDTLALELRQQGIFSRSVHEDYCEFVERHRPRKMHRRHLPLASVLVQNHTTTDEQNALDGHFHDAIQRCDLANAAKFLDAGADINSYYHGRTALEFCVENWLDTKAVDPDLPSEYTTIAEFLMLYKETCITYMFECRATILHLCMHIGATSDFMKPFFEIEGPEKALCHWDRYGRTILHTAVLASTSGIFALEQINELYGSIPIEQIVDSNGVSVCELAQLPSASKHLSTLQDLVEAYPKRIERNKPRTRMTSSHSTTSSSKQHYHIFVTNPDPVE